MGLQNLSAFGQSLQASTDTWENIFVISITIYSMVLFVFFIGNVQVYLQSEMIRQKKRVDFEFLRNLPEELRKNVKRKLCLEFLKKVDEFRSCEQLLEELCDCVKLVSHDQHTVIVQKGRSIDHMLFLVQGELQTYSLTSVDSAGSTANPPSNLPISIERLEKGEFYGKELVDLFQADLNPSNLPISTRTIQTITKVDAFALMSYDLQNVFIKHRTQVQAPLPADSQPQAPPPPAEPPVQQPASRI